jgi:secretion/DNA translocation related TadE-like protein
MSRARCGRGIAHPRVVPASPVGRWAGKARRFRRGSGSPWCSDRGSASVWSVAVIASLCVVFGALLGLGHACVVRHRAAGGADLAALAAPDHWAAGGAAACARADRVAHAQGARLVRCALVGDASDVTAASGQGPVTARVRARAGPGRLPDAPVPPEPPGPLPGPGPTPSRPSPPVSPPVSPAVPRAAAP